MLVKRRLGLLRGPLGLLEVGLESLALVVFGQVHLIENWLFVLCASLGVLGRGLPLTGAAEDLKHARFLLVEFVLHCRTRCVVGP